jgi:hypothetical protein
MAVAGEIARWIGSAASDVSEHEAKAIGEPLRVEVRSCATELTLPQLDDDARRERALRRMAAAR